jgi:hypothetical protein
MVDQVKEEHYMGGWGRMPPTTYEFLQYRYICYIEAGGYFHLAQLNSEDMSEESRNTAIGYFSRARAIYDEFGDEINAKLMKENIHLIRAESGDAEVGNVKIIKNTYHNLMESLGPNADGTIVMIAYNHARRLFRSNHIIEAERLLTKLAATSRQVYGEDHNYTKESVALSEECKVRLALLASPYADGKFQALRYENDGAICIVTGPIVDKCEKGQTLRVPSAMVHPIASCPVICHGLINAPHLNGKLGAEINIRRQRRTSIWGALRRKRAEACSSQTPELKNCI